MTWLLDGNMLVALALEGHECHDRAFYWFDQQKGCFATCVITQGTLLRVHMIHSMDRSAASAWNALKAIVKHPDHVFWDDAFGYVDVSYKLLHGPKQITDAWLAELARRRKGKIATLDAAFATVQPDVAMLVPV